MRQPALRAGAKSGAAAICCGGACEAGAAAHPAAPLTLNPIRRDEGADSGGGHRVRGQHTPPKQESSKKNNGSCLVAGLIAPKSVHF